MNKYQQLQNMILQKICNGEFKVGDTLPSRMQLTRKYHCSGKTVEHALRPLREQGVLTSVRGGKTKVTALFPEQKEPTNLFIVSGATMGDFSENEMRDLFVPDLDYPVSVRSLREKDILKYADAMSQASSAIIWAMPGQESLWFLRYFERWNVPQLMINREYFHYNRAVTDSLESIRDGLLWLKKSGCRKLAMVCDDPNGEIPYLQSRIIAFLTLAAAMNFQLAEEDVLLRDFSVVPSEISVAGKRLFNSPKQPDAIVILNQLLTLPLLTCGHVFGKIPGRDYHLLAYDYSSNLLHSEGIAMIVQQHKKLYLESRRWLTEGFARRRLPFHSKIKAELCLCGTYRS